MTDPGGKAVFQQQMTLLGEKGDRALNESPNAGESYVEDDIEPEEAQLVSLAKRLLDF